MSSKACAWGALIACFASACSGGDDSGGASGGGGGTTHQPPPGGCYPGEYEACTCPSGLASIRECLADGGRGPCSCEVWGPGPGKFQGGTSSNPNFTLLKLPVFDVRADPVSDVLYVSVGSPAAEDADSFLALSADTGKKAWSLGLGGAPGALAVSDDGSTAYVGLRAAHDIAQIDLSTHVETATHPLPSSGLPQYAYNMAVVPGSTSRLLVVPSDFPEQPGYGELILLENGALVGMPDPFISADEIVPTTATTAFGFDTDTTGASLYTITVGASGYTATVPKDQAFEAFSKNAIFDGTWLMLDSGEVIEPATLQVVGKYGRLGPLVSSPATNRVYVVSTEGTDDVVVVAFDRQSFAELGKLAIQSVKGRPRRAALSKNGTLAAVIGPVMSTGESQLLLVQPKALPGAN